VSHPALWKKLIFAAFPTVLLVAVAETLVRLTGAAETCPTYRSSKIWTCDPILYFKARPDAAPDMNSRGFRGREPGKKEPGTYRILALGDSCTFGFASLGGRSLVPAPYPQRLQELVDERAGPGKVDVLNAGSPGYNTYQGIMLLRSKLRDLDPDLITVRFGWNDHLMSPESWIENAFKEFDSRWVRGAEDLLLQTQLYPFALRMGMELRFHLQKYMRRPLPSLPGWRPNVPLDNYEHNLRRLAELGRAQGAQVWFLTAPSAFLTPALLAKYEALPADAPLRLLLAADRLPSFTRMMEIHEQYTAATRKVAAELGVPVVDLDALYHRHADMNLFGMGDFVHPTQEGHDLDAEALYDRLVDEKVLPVEPVKDAQRIE